MYQNTSHVDYITFSTQISSHGEQDGSIHQMDRHRQLLLLVLPQFKDFVHALYQLPLKVGGAMKGYTYHAQYDSGGAQLCWGGNNGTLYFEMPGGACKLFREVGRANEVALTEADLFLSPLLRFKRIDLATDIVTEDDPQDLDEFINPDQVLSRHSDRTITGRSEYYGSDKSERQLIVYRYEKPHPRYQYLRWEFRLRGEKAKDVALKFPVDGISKLISRLLDDWGVTYPLLANLTGITPSDKLAYAKKSKGGRIRWIYGQAIPALAKEVREGTMTIDEITKAIKKIVADKKKGFKKQTRT